jgi:hypothetical protein
MRDYKDLVIESLSDDVVRLEAEKRQLIDLLADSSLENAMVREFWDREYRLRVQRDRELRQLREQLHRGSSTRERTAA